MTSEDKQRKQVKLLHAYTEHPKYTIVRSMVWLSVTLLIVTLTLIALLFFVFGYKLKVNPVAKEKAVAVLAESTSAAKLKTITSSMGFSIKYDSNTYSSYGFVSNTSETRPGYVSGEEFKDNELGTKRGYTIVTISPRKSTEKDKNTSFSSFPTELTITTNIRKDFFATRLTESQGDSKSQLEYLKEYTENREKKSGGTVKGAEKITINGKEFYKITTETSSTILGVTKYTQTHTYATVNDNSPYWFKITPINLGQDEGDVPPLEAIIATVQFTKHDAGSVVKKDGSVKLASSEKVKVDTANIRGYVNDDDLIKIVARNQIATVRIGMIHCADIVYKSESGISFIAKNACSAGTGSGSIISNDGYVATNGHVVYSDHENMIDWAAINFTSDEWRNYFSFILNSGHASREQLKDYYERVAKKDEAALKELVALLKKTPTSNISYQNEVQEIAVQTSNAPMQINIPSGGGRLTWKQSDSVVLGGKLIDYEVEKNRSSNLLESSKSDIAIIKINGSYPAVELGSAKNMKIGDTVTALGYPAIVDGGLSTKEFVTVPSVSQGTIRQVGNDAGGHRLFIMSAQIAAGNSGGPSFDQSGKQVGINTYGGRQCPEDSGGNSCFGMGVARDIDDIKGLASKNNIGLKTDSEITRSWQSGIDKFVAGDFKVAAQEFKTLDAKYPNNYLVKKFLVVSEKQVSSTTTQGLAAPTNETVALAIGAAVAGLASLLLIGISSTMVLLHHRRLRR